MSEEVNANGWCYLPTVVSGFQSDDWMDLAWSVSTMLKQFKGKCLNLSLGNFVYNTKTKECWIVLQDEVKHNGSPFKLRWYPRAMWGDFTQIELHYDVIAAMVVLEFIYGKSPFYHEDAKTFKRNIRRRIRTAGTPAPKDRKAVWMLMTTAFVGNRLVDGRAYLDIISRDLRLEPDEIIANWEDKDEDWGPRIWRKDYDWEPSSEGEHDSGISAQSEEGRAGSEAEGNSPKLAAEPEPPGQSNLRLSD